MKGQPNLANSSNFSTKKLVKSLMDDERGPALETHLINKTTTDNDRIYYNWITAWWLHAIYWFNEYLQQYERNYLSYQNIPSVNIVLHLTTITSLHITYHNIEHIEFLQMLITAGISSCCGVVSFPSMDGSHSPVIIINNITYCIVPKESRGSLGKPLKNQSTMVKPTTHDIWYFSNPWEGLQSFNGHFGYLSSYLSLQGTLSFNFISVHSLTCIFAHIKYK